MHLVPFDYYSDSPNAGVGLTHTASLIQAAREQARREGALVLLFDNGDALQGTPFGEWAAEAVPDAHPLSLAFNALGYDAIGLGNHDFGFGLEFVNRFTAQTACPVICSNMKAMRGSQGWVAQAILQREVHMDGQDLPVRIGVLSVLPPQVTRWEAHMLRDKVESADILTTAQRIATKLRNQGCDLVVALAHSGLDRAMAEPEMENAVIPLAKQNEIDVIVAGHTHLTLPGPSHSGLPHVDSKRGLVHGTPVVMPGWAGSHLGIIDLTLELDEGQRWRVSDCRVEAAPVRQATGLAPENPEMARLFAPGHAKTRKRVSHPVGSVTKPLHSYFSFCAPDRGLALMAAAQAAALRPYLAGTKWEGLPLLSAAAPAKFGGRAGPGHYTDVPAGDVSIRHVADLHIFPNELRAVQVTGAQVRDWLEMSAGVLNQLHKNEPVNLSDHKRAGFNFDVLHGITCQIDLTQPARFDSAGRLTDPSHSRIRALEWDGRPLETDQLFVVATNNYRANGGGQFPFAAVARQIELPSLRIHDILCDYVSGEYPSDPLEQAPRPFSFAPTDRAKAILHTGPGAYKYLDELAEYKPTILPEDTEGFLPIQLTL